jgi:transaldolase
MRRIGKDWPLRMIFSERKDNEFVADVNLLVTDMRGAPVLVLPAAGIDLEALADNLQSDGAAAFVKSWHELLSVIAAKSKALA